MEILKDALASHLDQVRNLIEQWRSALYLPRISEVYKGTVLPTPNKTQPLFSCLREHLPFPTLWRNYFTWEREGNEYLDGCKRLVAEIEVEGRGWDGVRKITDSFAWPVLERLNDKVRGEEPKVHRFEPLSLAHDVDLLIVDGREVLEASNPLSFSQVYQTLSDRILASESATNLIALFNKLKTLEPKIHQSLDEILLRHDHIMYSCKFCPGLPR